MKKLNRTICGLYSCFNGSRCRRIALSGTASVSYDDNGSAASATTYDADLVVTGTNGGTTVTAGYDINGASAEYDVSCFSYYNWYGD